jgi:hypothetical protein
MTSGLGRSMVERRLWTMDIGPRHVSLRSKPLWFPGTELQQVTIPKVSKDNLASRQAIGDAFRWVVMDMEPSGKEIYSHRWVQALMNAHGPVTLDEPNEAAAAGPTVDDLERIQHWLETIESYRTSLHEISSEEYYRIGK